MSWPSLIAAFSRLPTDHLPDVHSLDERLQVFWTLSVAKANSDMQFLTPAEVSDILCQARDVAVTRQRVNSILEHAKKSSHVAFNRRAGKSYFKIMKKGEDELLGFATAPIFIDPSKRLSSIRAVEQVFGALEGSIKICDTYIDNRTIDYIAQSKKAQSIKLLTENIQDGGRLRRDADAFSRETGKAIEIRVSPAGQLHDRYVLHSGGMLLIGASLKDMAKKQSMIVTLPKSFATEIEKVFERNWSNASKFI